ncbi:hypothetical protein Cantr_10429 [Candida viswanathii]|uniref:Glycine-rich domain-containing protein 1 n=1 Tax=Candida viswanathii TaxID=5486 RepID=A0A367YF05_9ASCO|nr:hypothetical protein Cantr_10429 [Candida viswanathii]
MPFKSEPPPSYDEISNLGYNEKISRVFNTSGFRSTRYSNLTEDEEVEPNHQQAPKFIPTTAEAITHLRLLKAFGELKKRVLGDYEKSFDPIKADNRWNLYLTVAVRRFILFISALKLRTSKIPKDKTDVEKTTDSRSREFTKMANELVPPLDVLMVWHAFMLNPMTFYDVFVRNDMYYFVNYPFPLHIIEKYIDGQTFQFMVPDDLKKNYVAFLSEFTHDDADLQYDIDPTSFHEQMVTIYCPFKGEPITEPVPLTAPNNRGFGDLGFMTSSTGDYRYRSLHHWYGGPETITRDVLRLIILDYDVRKDGYLEGIFKYYSKVTAAPQYSRRSPKMINDAIVESVITAARLCFLLKSQMLKVRDGFPTLQNILRLVRSPNGKRRTAESLILERYLRFNVISLTVPNAVQIGEDLVACVLRQEKFAEKVNSFDWLRSLVLEEALEESLVRYGRYFTLLTSKSLKRSLVPTLDIDLMWHTHQLMLYGYIRDCKYSPCQTVIDHNDDVGKSCLDDGFAHTARLYKDKYKEDYSICLCDYCVSKKTSSGFKLFDFFKLAKSSKPEEVTPRSSLFESDGKGMTHTSGHGISDALVSCMATEGDCCTVVRISGENGPYIGSSFIGADWPSAPENKSGAKVK